MEEERLSRAVTVSNPEGLHVRPCDMISKLARKYTANVELVHGQERADAKSIMSLLTIAASAQCGAKLQLEAVGEDAAAALDALEKLFADQFAME